MSTGTYMYTCTPEQFHAAVLLTALMNFCGECKLRNPD